MADYERLSWRKLKRGDRVYDQRLNHPVVLFVVPTSKKTRYWVGVPAWYATTGPWRLVPRAGVVKVLRREGGTMSSVNNQRWYFRAVNTVWEFRGLFVLLFCLVCLFGWLFYLDWQSGWGGP